MNFSFSFFQVIISFFSVAKPFLQGVEFSNPDLQAFETFFFRFELWQETDSILKEVHYLHYPYSLKYANFSDVNAVPNRVLCGALTGNDDHDCRRGSSPAINIPL